LGISVWLIGNFLIRYSFSTKGYEPSTE